MVKYYFQLINGGLSFVVSGEKEDLVDLVHKEFEMDKEEALRRLDESLKEKEVALEQLAWQEAKDESDKLELDCKIANLKKSIYDNKKEIERVKAQEKSNLVFFEATPIDL